MVDGVRKTRKDWMEKVMRCDAVVFVASMADHFPEGPAGQVSPVPVLPGRRRGRAREGNEVLLGFRWGPRRRPGLFAAGGVRQAPQGEGQAQDPVPAAEQDRCGPRQAGGGSSRERRKGQGVSCSRRRSGG